MSSELTDPFRKYSKKLNDSKKRDFMVKKLKKEREELHLQRQRRLEEEDEEDEEEYAPPARAGAIVVVKNSYLTQSLSEMNNSLKNNLPKKWSKNDLPSSSEEDDDGDDEDDEDDEEEDDVGEEARRNKELNAACPQVYEESDDDNEEEHLHTQRRVVQIIEAFNEVETIEEEPNIKHNKDYNEAKTTATKQMRENSKSPRLTAREAKAAQSPKVGSLSPHLNKNSPKIKAKNGGHDDNDDDDDELGSFSLKSNRGGVGGNVETKQQKASARQLEQELRDLDFSTITAHIKSKNTHDLSPLPHEDELDTGVWWKYILDHGAEIQRDGVLKVRVVEHFPPAQDHEIPEDFFHFPPGRKSPPEKPLTAFGLFKKHCMADPEYHKEGEQEDEDASIKKNKKAKKTKAKKVSVAENALTIGGAGRSRQKQEKSDAYYKALFFKLEDVALIDYYTLALIEKIRYKSQRVEYIFQQSTQFGGTKGHKK